MHPAFICRHKVGFAHCDPAGIVFYPRYFEMVNATVEEWFETGLGCGFAQLHGPMQAAVPTVSLKVDFKRPSRLGDVLMFALFVGRVGRSSLDLQIEMTGENDPAGQSRLTATLTLVFTQKGITGATPWPENLRAKLESKITRQDHHDT
ncbi:hypothetical protein LF95_22635 [Thalassospira sp. TSL5-1]|nr:hypothetical protein LF95_22635 [Thalassospira sp. TSL5-1]